MSKTISLDRTKFNTLISCFNLINVCNCNDCHITNGLVRQRSNCKRCIIEADMSDIVGNEDQLIINNLKTKSQLLSSFIYDNTQKSDDGVTIEITDKKYIFKDSFSKFEFIIPLTQYIDNSYIEDTDFNNMIALSDVDKMFEGSLSYHMTKRIKAAADGFNVENITFNCNDKVAKLFMTTIDQTSSTEISDSFVMNFNRQNKPFSFDLPLFPLSSQIESDATFEVFQKPATEIFICKMKRTFNGIPFVFYSHAKLKD